MSRPDAEVDVTVTWLALALTPSSARSVALPSRMTLQLEAPPQAAELAATLYREVGEGFQWRDRLPWTDGEWQQAIHRDGVELWTMRSDGGVAGYFELHRHQATVELRYFGLTTEFIGQGLGRVLLDAVIARAAELGARRLTVNTCTLDHPAALHNYLARGFTTIRRVNQRRVVAP